MSPLAVTLVTVAFVLQVVGQVFFKVAMDETGATKPVRQRAGAFAAGITAMALSFFIGLSQLSQLPLSKYYPFEGIERVVIVISAAFFLKEKITLRIGLGVALICGGLFLVAG
ncbi:MAG: EamA family transporter [Chthoniobacteraceae bacterium]